MSCGNERKIQLDSGVRSLVEVEHRLELLNCLANTEQEFLKRLYDRTPIWKRYREGEIAAHFHCEQPEPFCLRWSRRDFGPLKYLLDPDQTIVPVPIGEIAQEPDPIFIGSTVRLKPLEKCEMFIPDTLKIGVAMIPEALWAAFNRKLDLFADSARILLAKSTGEIVQRVAQAACELANYDSNRACVNIARFRRDIVPSLFGNEVWVRMDGVLPEPFQVFTCPIQQEIDFLELIQHAAKYF
jgi:hypothetical protein